MILARVATLREMEEWYSIDDLADRNDALDAMHEAQRELNSRRKPERG